MREEIEQLVEKYSNVINKLSPLELIHFRFWVSTLGVASRFIIEENNIPHIFDDILSIDRDIHSRSRIGEAFLNNYFKQHPDKEGEFRETLSNYKIINWFGTPRLRYVKKIYLKDLLQNSK